MALSNEDLLAISQLLDIKLKSALQAELQPLKDDIRYIKLHLENETDKRIQLLAENYVPAAKRYEKAVPEIEAMQADISIMKRVIEEHSEKLNKLAQQLHNEYHMKSVKSIELSRDFALFIQEDISNDQNSHIL